MDDKSRPRIEADLSFRKQRPVDWLNPLMLLKTGIATVVSAMFGNFSDKREIQVALNHHSNLHDYSSESELWFDFVADTGDGFDPTYSIAYLLAQKSLSPEGLEGELPRGRFLLMGGDEVYPAASRQEYRDRLQGPYQAALPYVVEGEERPHLYAIPGNHDWYDGLTSFLRIFRKGNSVGGWVTRQSRSYFSIRLPNNWWIWAVDIALDSYVDTPQVEYFSELAQQMGADDRVILCNSEPSWIYKYAGDETPWKNLDYIAQIATARGARVTVNLTGDLHHYALYVPEGEQDSDSGFSAAKITAGGGGAFMHPTHMLPDKLDLTESGQAQGYVNQGVYPDKRRSRSLVWRNLALPFQRRAMTLFLGIFYVSYIWMLNVLGQFNHLPFNAASIYNFTDTVSQFWKLQQVSPGLLLINVILLFGLFSYCEYRLAPVHTSDRLLKALVAVAHTLLHIAGILLTYTLIGRQLVNGDTTWDCVSNLLTYGVGGVVVGGLIGAWLLALYLILSNQLFGFNYMNAYSSMPVEDYKQFLRIHVQEDSLTIYPIVVDKVKRNWAFNPEGEYDQPWIEPVGPIQTRIVDSGIVRINK